MRSPKKVLIVTLSVLILQGCKAPETALERVAEPTPIDDTVELIPEPTAAPVASPSPTPSPTPQLNACNDEDYPLIGSWQNVEKPEDVLHIYADCTYISEACQPLPRPWSVLETNAEMTGASLVFDVQGGEVNPDYCTPLNGINTDTKSGAWTTLNNTGPNQMEISYHYRIGSQMYVRIP